MIVRGNRGMKVAIRKFGAMLGAGLLLTGCVSLGGEVPEQLITLTARNTAPAGEMDSGTIGNAIVVLDPDTDRRLDVARVPVQINDSTLAYLKDAVWVERPARQFRRLLAETIRAKSKRIVVESSDYEVSGKTVLSGRLIDMGYDSRTQSVVVRYDAVIEGSDGVIKSRRFESVMPGISDKAVSVAPALNEAANAVAVEVAEWISE